MKVKEIMERAGITETGRAVAWIKDALADISRKSPLLISTDSDVASTVEFFPDNTSFFTAKQIVISTPFNSAGNINSNTGWKTNDDVTLTYDSGTYNGWAGHMKFTNPAGNTDINSVLWNNGNPPITTFRKGCKYEISYKVWVPANKTIKFYAEIYSDGTLMHKTIDTQVAAGGSGQALEISEDFICTSSTNVTVQLKTGGTESHFAYLHEFNIESKDSIGLNAEGSLFQDAGITTGHTLIISGTASNNGSGKITPTAIRNNFIECSAADITLEADVKGVEIRAQKTSNLDIVKDKRFYEFPENMVKLISVRCKGHLNSKSEYRSIPRLIGDVVIKDEDNI